MTTTRARKKKNDDQQELPKQKPIDEIRVEGIRAAIWRNEGEKGPWYAVTIDRSYRDSENQWHNTQSFRFSDLPTIATICDQAHNRIAQLIAQEHNRGAASNGR